MPADSQCGVCQCLIKGLASKKKETRDTLRAMCALQNYDALGIIKCQAEIDMMATGGIKPKELSDEQAYDLCWELFVICPKPHEGLEYNELSCDVQPL